MLLHYNKGKISPPEAVVLCRIVSPLRSVSPQTRPISTGKQNSTQHCVNWQYKKLVIAVTNLMLTLAQVVGFLSSYYQTSIKHSTVHSKQV